MQIENLKKISLRIKAGDKPGVYNLLAEPVDFNYIHGVASEGLSELERELHQRKIGDEVVVTVARKNAGEVCGYLLKPLRLAFGLKNLPESLYLAINVVAVDEPENREIIMAMAEALKKQGGCGVTCDCGCG